jgi:hypothetical protein
MDRVTAGYCHHCRSNVRGSSAVHRATAKHRAATLRRTDGPVRPEREVFAERMRRAFRAESVTAEQNAAAMARLDPWYAADDPDAPDAYAPEDPLELAPVPSAAPRKIAPSVTMPHPPQAASVRVNDRAPKLDPCPRCKRTTWRTTAGREWHLANNPACADYRKPERHQYAIGG